MGVEGGVAPALAVQQCLKRAKNLMVNFFTSRVFLQLPSLAHKEFIIAFLPHYAALSGPRCQCWLIKLHPKYDFFALELNI